MWWWLSCQSPKTDESEHVALQTEVSDIEQRVGAVTSRLGALETDVERRMADLEAQLTIIAKEQAEREKSARPTPKQEWLGTWNVRASVSANHDCTGPIEPTNYRWTVVEGASEGQLSLSVDGGETRFRSFSLQLEPGTGVLTGMQAIDRDSSIVIVQREGEGFVGHRIYNSAGGGPCARIWRLEGERI